LLRPKIAAPGSSRNESPRKLGYEIGLPIPEGKFLEFDGIKTIQAGFGFRSHVVDHRLGSWFRGNKLKVADHCGGAYWLAWMVHGFASLAGVVDAGKMLLI
jgi:hypothetical protein